LLRVSAWYRTPALPTANFTASVEQVVLRMADLYIGNRPAIHHPRLVTLVTVTCAIAGFSLMVRVPSADRSLPEFHPSPEKAPL